MEIDIKPRELIIYLWTKHSGDTAAILDAMKNNIELNKIAYQSTIAAMGDLSRYVTVVDDDYPTLYEKIFQEKCPFVIPREEAERVNKAFEIFILELVSESEGEDKKKGDNKNKS